MGVRYRVDIAKATFAEIWRLCRGNLTSFLAVSCQKLFGSPFYAGPVVDSGRMRFLEPSDIPAHVLDSLQSILAEATAVGLHVVAANTVENDGGAEGFGVFFMDPHRDFWLHVTWVRALQLGRPVIERSFAATSQLEDGHTLATANAIRRFNMPPELSAEYRTDMDIRGLIDRHRSRIADKRPRRFGNPKVELPIVVHQLAERLVQFNLERGVFVAAD